MTSSKERVQGMNEQI